MERPGSHAGERERRLPGGARCLSGAFGVSGAGGRLVGLRRARWVRFGSPAACP
jgi:hypothetical protein